MQNASGTALPVIDVGRRNFFKGLGKAGAGVTAAALLFGDLPLLKAQSSGASQDTANQIFLAALIAEDLATTFYYNGLVGPVVQDPNLAGPGGTATKPNPKDSNVPNLDYLRAALNQEIAHANLLRTVGNIAPNASGDPYKTFYFPAGTFSTLKAFTATLTALENAFIGAYLNAIREFASLASRSGERGVPSGPYGGPYSAEQLEYFAEVAASILGVECEHRVLGGVINNVNQPNNLYFESTDGLTSVYHGSKSAVAALAPFLDPNTGPAYSLSTALSDASMVGLPSTGTIPPQ
jgi:hypothetical protein